MSDPPTCMEIPQFLFEIFIEPFPNLLYNNTMASPPSENGLLTCTKTQRITFQTTAGVNRTYKRLPAICWRVNMEGDNEWTMFILKVQC